MGIFDELKRLTKPYGEDEDEFFDKGTQQEEAGPPIAPTERRESFFTDEEEAEPPSISIPKPSFHLPKRAERAPAKQAAAAQRPCPRTSPPRRDASGAPPAGGGCGAAVAGAGVGLHAGEAEGVCRLHGDS